MSILNGYIAINTRSTAFSGPHTSMLGYCSRTHDYKELIAPEKEQKHYGFCLNPKCDRNENHLDPQWSKSKWIAVFRTRIYLKDQLREQKDYECIDCGHAVVWSNRYQSMQVMDHRDYLMRQMKSLDFDRKAKAVAEARIAASIKTAADIRFQKLADMVKNAQAICAELREDVAIMEEEKRRIGLKIERISEILAGIKPPPGISREQADRAYTAKLELVTNMDKLRRRRSKLNWQLKKKNDQLLQAGMELKRAIEDFDIYDASRSRA